MNTLTEKLNGYLKEQGFPTNPTPSMLKMMREKLLNMSDEEMFNGVFNAMEQDFFIDMVNEERETLFELYIKGENVPLGSYMKEPFTEGEMLVVCSSMRLSYVMDKENSMLYHAKDELKKHPHTLQQMIVFTICKEIRKEGIDLSHIENFFSKK